MIKTTISSVTVSAARLSLSAVLRRKRVWIHTTLAYAVPLAALLEANYVNGSTQPLASQPGMAYVSALSVSAPSVDLTLADAVYLGLRDNRSIRSAYLQRINEKFTLRLAKDKFLPQSSITTKFQANRGTADVQRDYSLTPSATLLNQWGTVFSLSWAQQFNQANGGGGSRDNKLGFGFVQPLLRGAGREIVTAPLRAAHLDEENNRLKLQAKVSETVTQIVQAYRELLKAQEQQRIAQAAMVRYRDLLQVNKALIKAGRMAEFESVQTEEQLASQEMSVEDTANQLDRSRLKLVQLLALDQGTQLRASELIRVERVEVDRQQALRIALAQQPDYLQQLIAGKQARIKLRLAEDQRLWDVSLVGGASQSHKSPGTRQNHANRSWDSYAGIQLTIPIGDLSARQQLVGAQVALKDYAIQHAGTRQILEQNVNDDVRDLGTRWRQYEIAQRVHKLSLQKLDIERDKLQLGRSSNFQVLSFEEDLLRAENGILNAQIAYLDAQTQLDQRLGMTLQSWEIALND